MRTVVSGPFNSLPSYHPSTGEHLMKLPLTHLAADAVAVRFDAAAVRGRKFFGQIINIKPAATHYFDIRREGERALEITRVKYHHHISPPPRPLIFSDLARQRFHIESCFFFRLAYRRRFGRLIFIHTAARQRPRPRRVPMSDENDLAVLHENDTHALNAARAERGPVAHRVHYRNNSKREVHADFSDGMHDVYGIRCSSRESRI